MNIAEWAEKAIADKAWLFHEPTHALGVPIKFYSGLMADQYVSSINGEPVPGPVIMLESGHGLLAKPENFVLLTEKEIQFFTAAQLLFSEFLRGVITKAAEGGLDQHASMRLLSSMLKAQVAAMSPKNEVW